MEKIILVDENDNQVGTCEKIEGHKNGGKLHRAFSVFIFNSKGEMLLQKRGNDKYHFGGLWTNTCCSHPRDGETTEQAAHRRLSEEMGFDCPIKEIFAFIYKATFSNGLTEWEYDHVFIGTHDGEIKPNPNEADGFVWMTIDDLKKDIIENPQKYPDFPERYTPWFKQAFKRVIEAVGKA
jgi:isopentenyl-diphosphate Delta-isomerase